MNPSSNTQILTAYRQGFNDYLDGKAIYLDGQEIDYAGSELEKHAYSWGIAHAHYGDDMPSLDYRSEEEILKTINESFLKGSR